jgi:hypothetical protein
LGSNEISTSPSIFFPPFPPLAPLSFRSLSRNLKIIADGLRNEVGLRFDANGQLWGVENGADDLYRADLGGDIHNDNPGEEIVRSILSFPFFFPFFLFLFFVICTFSPLSSF